MERGRVRAALPTTRIERDRRSRKMASGEGCPQSDIRCWRVGALHANFQRCQVCVGRA